MGKDVTMKKDLELRPEDVKDKDVLISLGRLFEFPKFVQWLTLDAFRRRWNISKNIWDNTKLRNTYFRAKHRPN